MVSPLLYQAIRGYRDGHIAYRLPEASPVVTEDYRNIERLYCYRLTCIVPKEILPHPECSPPGHLEPLMKAIKLGEWTARIAAVYHLVSLTRGLARR